MSARAWLCRAIVLSASIAAIYAAPHAVQAAAKPAATQRIEIHHPDHYEFSASLNAPFHPDMHGMYPLTLYFDYPGAGRETLDSWQVDVQDAKGTTVRRWIGEIGVPNQHAHYVVNWDGRDTTGHALPPGPMRSR